MIKYRVFSDLYFPALGVNMEIYRVKLTYIYLGQRVVKSHDGPSVIRSIINGHNSRDVKINQVEVGKL